MMDFPTAPSEPSSKPTGIDEHQSIASGSFFDWLFPGIFIVIGIALILFEAWNLQGAIMSMTWPDAEGIIRSSKLHESLDRKGVTYFADVSYDYVVSGKRYRGTKVSFSDFGLVTTGHANSIIGRYPAGKKSFVFYAPDNPAVSVLERGISFSSGFASAFVLFAGGGFIVAGFFLGPSRKSNNVIAGNPTLQP